MPKKNNQKCFNQEDHWSLKKERTSYEVTARFLRIFESVKYKKFAVFRTMVASNPGKKQNYQFSLIIPTRNYYKSNWLFSACGDI